MTELRQYEVNNKYDNAWKASGVCEDQCDMDAMDGTGYKIERNLTCFSCAANMTDGWLETLPENLAVSKKSRTALERANDIGVCWLRVKSGHHK